jgi:hypothetical protein
MGLEQLFRTGTSMSPARQKKVGRSVGYRGAADQVTGKEFRKATKGKQGEQFQQYLTRVSGAVPISALKGKAKSAFEKAGFAEFDGYYGRPISAKDVKKAASQGYAKEDVEDYLAQKFLGSQLSGEVSRFVGESGRYKVDPVTGKYVKNVTDIKETGEDSSASPFGKSISAIKDFLDGLSPEGAPGSTIAEMEYATQIDPYKIQAKSAREQALIDSKTRRDLAQIQQANSLYGLIGYAFT